MTDHRAQRGAPSPSTDSAGGRRDAWPIELPSWLQTPLRPTTVARAAVDPDRGGEAPSEGDTIAPAGDTASATATTGSGSDPAGAAAAASGDHQTKIVGASEAAAESGGDAIQAVGAEAATTDDAVPVETDPPAGDAAAEVAPELPFLTTPSGWTDVFTALDGPIYWARLLSGEGARIKRYRRPATVVFFQVVALDELARQWGEDVAVQCTLQVARTLSRHIRSSDHAVRLGPARFGAFLPETNEIDAINFVERCRAAVARDVGVAADTITLAIGWAGPVDGDLAAGVELAEARLEREIQAAAS